MKWLIAMLMFTVASCGYGYPKEFMPENDLYKQDNFFLTNMNETTFNQVATTIYNIYKPIVAGLGGNLVLKLNWKDSTVNAYADREDGNWNISFFGGLARRPEMTADGFAMVVCHELSHHLGGFPLYQGDAWASNEGQSDYSAAHVCMQKYFAGDKTNVPYLQVAAVNKCKAIYTGQKLRECYHRMVAAKSCADLLGALNGNAKPSFGTFDPKVVRRTSDSHPDAQCRLDTMVAGTLCQAPWDDRVIPTARNQGTYNCNIDNKLEAKVTRPRCWYAPASQSRL